MFGAELIEQLKQKLDSTEQRLQFAELTIQSLQIRLRQMLIKKYGASSETLSNAQLELLELEPGVSGDEVEAESAREALPPAPPEDSEAPDRKPRSKHPGRQTLPAHLPRVERIVACTPVLPLALLIASRMLPSVFFVESMSTSNDFAP